MTFFRTLFLAFAVTALLASCQQPEDLTQLPIEEPPEEAEKETANAETVETRGEQKDIPIVSYDAPLCTFGRREGSVGMEYKDRDGLPVQGEIPEANYGSFPSRIASVVARPNADQYRVVQSRDCHDEKTDTYYSCPKVTEVKLGDIRGIGRGNNREVAARLAARACRREVQKRMDKQAEIRLESYDLDCRVIETAFCRPKRAGE